MSTSASFPTAFLPGVMLKAGDYLRSGEYIHSYNGGFFAVLQSDGNFAIYTGTCPADVDNHSFLWCSAVTGYETLGPFFAVLQHDGNFCVYYGTPEKPRELLWQIDRTAPGGKFLAVLHDNGIFAVYRGEIGDFSHPVSVLWDTQTAGTPGYKLMHDVVTEYPIDQTIYSNYGVEQEVIWQSFTQKGSGFLGRIDVRVGTRDYETELLIREGVGLEGRVLARATFIPKVDPNDDTPWTSIVFETEIKVYAGGQYTMEFRNSVPPGKESYYPRYSFTTKYYQEGRNNIIPYSRETLTLAFITYRTPPWMDCWPYPPIM